MSNSALFIEQIEIGPMQNFVYVIGSNRTREAALVDPAWDIGALLDRLDQRDFTPVAALVTHYHPDHIGGHMMGHDVEGLAQLLAARDMKAYVHKSEAPGVKKITGVEDSDLVKVESGDKLRVGDIEIEFLHTPGHTPGSQCFRVSNTLVSGDTLFIQGCGRVDLPGSDPDQMYESLKRLAALPDETLVLPGHNYGAVSKATLEQTKQANPFLGVPDLKTWRHMMGKGPA